MVLWIIIAVLAILAVLAGLYFILILNKDNISAKYNALDETEKKNFKKNIFITCIILVVALLIGLNTGSTFKKFYEYDPYFDTTNVSRIQYLKQYSPNLEGTIAGDTEIYIIAGKNVKFDGYGNVINPEQYPSLLILGGTHPNEPSGQLAATVILENAVVGDNSILYVITEADKSGYSHAAPQEASTYYYHLETATGKQRVFKFGSRPANPVDQWPNPDVYTTASGMKLSTNDARNLNRSYPGSIDGTYSEQMAYGVTQLIKTNDIKMTIDLHEASPEYLTINAMVYHEHGSSIASSAVFDLTNFYDVEIEPNPSPKTLHGLTHRELGDYTNTIAILCETSNSAQGKIRGQFNEALILDGMTDKFYRKAVAITTPKLKIIYGTPATIGLRVGRHVQSVYGLINGYNFEVNDSTGFADFNADKPDRAAFLKSCGELEISIDLSSHLTAEQALEVESTLQGDNYYQALCTYGVGYFLADAQIKK